MEKNQLPAEAENYTVLIKKEAETNPDYGCSPEKRKIKDLIDYGIINVNKPPGPTSHQVADYVKRILNISKSGHSGTLDPKVTGVLPTALSKATRIVQTLLPSGKEYIALMRLHKKVSKRKIESTFKKFTGKINQLPPVRSAVKRQIRPRNVYYLEIMEIKDEFVLFKIGCQAGTYIRKICHDMGLSMNTGAHMAQLVRTKAGPFTDKNCHSLQDVADAYETYKETKDETELRIIIEPFENAVKFLPKVWIFDNAVSNIAHGAQLAPQGISKLTDNIQKGDLIAVMTLKDELICLGKSVMNSEEIMEKDSGIAVKTEKVFMERNVYPR